MSITTPIAELLRLLLLMQLVFLSKAEVDPIIIKGSHFFYKTNRTAFLIRGVAYYQGSLSSPDTTQTIDMLADGPTCERDIPYLSALNINVLRTYYLDPTRDHSKCMNAFADAGIYVITELSGLTSDTEFIPEFSDWDEAILAQFTGVVDSLSSFTNMLAFSVGHSFTAGGMPFVKAAIREVKQHIQNNDYRRIPVGWVQFQVPEVSALTMVNALDFLTCDQYSADFVAVAVPPTSSNCTERDDVFSAADIFRNATIPVFGDQTSCSFLDSTNDTRKFDYLRYFYSPSILEIFSGAVVAGYFESIDSDSNLGLVSVEVSGEIIVPLPGYSALSTAMGKLTPTYTNSADYTPTATAPPCPTQAPSWDVSSVVPPQINPQLCSCMMDTLQCTAKKTVIGNMDPFDFYDARTDVCEATRDNCTGLTRDPVAGKYGAFSVCNWTVAYSWAANEYWQSLGKCDINGTVELRGERPAPDSECAFLLQQAGENGEKTVTASITPTASPTTPQVAQGHPGGSGGGGSSLSTAEKAGIGVGVFAFVTLALLGILYVLHRKKQGKKTESDDQSDLPEYVPPTTETQNHRHSDLPEVQNLMPSPRQ